MKPPAPSSSVRLLIVDDEPPQRKALCDTLRDEGYTTVGCSDGPTALRLLRESSYDLILSDLMMPGMDGISLLQQALAIDHDLVGIIMTGDGTIATAVEAMKVGALDYILKPFRVSVVLPVISRALAVRRLRVENSELARRVQERTTELEEANRELESFSYSVSHDLRAPLRSINGFSSILLEQHSTQLSNDARHCLQHVVESAARMNQLIDDLLEFSRLGRQPVTKRPVDLAALVRRVATELAREHAGRSVTLKIADLPPAEGDPSLLQQVIVNLLSNAYKFTRDQPQATIEVGHREEHGETVYFVRDNGAGFEMDYVKRLFNPFQRLHSEREFPGTGVGLATVRRIVAKHGGRIWAEGRVGQGATFSFTLGSSPHAPTLTTPAELSANEPLPLTR